MNQPAALPGESTAALAPDGPAAGDTIEATVERLAHGGEGVARVGGLVVFLPWTSPGERVRATVLERHPSWARARLEEVLDPGPDRVAPPCPVFGTCGGCQLQHLTAVAQRAAKGRAVADAFDRIAGRPLPEPPVCEPAARPWNYRQRAVFTWRWQPDDLRVGFHAADEPRRLVSILECPILAEAANARLAAWGAALSAALAERDEPHPIEGRLAVRVLSGIEVQLGIFALDPVRARPLAEACARATGAPATWGRWTPGGASLSLAPDAPRLATRFDYRGLNLRVGFDSFLQADLSAAEPLYDGVLKGLGACAGERVMDGYAGVGVITCELARAGVSVTAVESHSGAASDLRANAAAAGGAVHVLELPAVRVDWRRARPDAIVLNPPRGGCPSAVLKSITRSPARRLVYVACDPTTLARDVSRLGAAWRIDSVAVFDLFPQTAHVETVAVLSREKTS